MRTQIIAAVDTKEIKDSKDSSDEDSKEVSLINDYARDLYLCIINMDLNTRDSALNLLKKIHK